MIHKITPYEYQINPAIDRNDPEAAKTAVEIRFPDTFSSRAWKVVRYFAGAMFLYTYKGKFVATDESLELTKYGDESCGAPFGGPHWTGDSLDELERWLEQLADKYDATDSEIPGWKPRKPTGKKSSASEYHESPPKVLVKLVNDGDYIGIRTYDRPHGGRGRFLIACDTLSRMLGEPDGVTHYDSDCGHFAEVRHSSGHLWFCITWLSHHKDGTVNGFRQMFAVPDQTIQRLLTSGENAKLLYSPVRAPVRIRTNKEAAKSIRNLAEDKLIRRAFSKAMRDCLDWPGDYYTLYKNGEYSFFFGTRSGFPKSGSLMLQEVTRNGRPYIYYSVDNQRRL